MDVKRVEKLRQKMLDLHIDALLISNFFNIFYFLGFETLTENEREAFALVTKKNIYLFTDARYTTDSPNFILRLFEPSKGLGFHLGEIVEKEKITSMGFESEDLRHFEYQALKEKLKHISFVPTSRVGVTVREIKDSLEIEKIKKACQITDSCLESILPTIKKDMTEKEIAFRIETYIKKDGNDLAFDPIVAIGVNSAVPHYNTKAGYGIVQNGSVILIDFGVKYEHYLSDITRMAFFGKPDDAVLKTYTYLQVAQQKAIDTAHTFSELKDIDIFCRKELSEKKLPDYAHSTGHGVGLEIHEYPKVSFNSPDKKINGQIITIEPGVYFPGKYGMRVEDTVVIQEGKAVELTHFTKEPYILSA